MDLKDIRSRKDIDRIVFSFYEKAMRDEIIGHFFTKVVHLDLETHLPIISDFWESVLFQNAKYKGNPMVKHIVLNRKSSMTSEHFQSWLNLWERTIDELHKGDLADNAKSRAKSIAALMQHKIKMDSL